MKTKIFALLLSSILMFSNCLGSFYLTKRTVKLNETITSNEYVNNVLFWVANILPIYGVVLFVDVAVFNLIEFWTGDNPIAMKPGEKKIEMVNANDKVYQLTKTQNNINIKVVEGADKGKEANLIYNTTESAWYINVDGDTIKLAEYKDGVNYVYLPNGNAVEISADATQSEGLAIINQELSNNDFNAIVLK